VEQRQQLLQLPVPALRSPSQPACRALSCALPPPASAAAAAACRWTCRLASLCWAMQLSASTQFMISVAVLSDITACLSRLVQMLAPAGPLRLADRPVMPQHCNSGGRVLVHAFQSPAPDGSLCPCLLLPAVLQCTPGHDHCSPGSSSFEGPPAGEGGSCGWRPAGRARWPAQCESAASSGPHGALRRRLLFVSCWHRMFYCECALFATPWQKSNVRVPAMPVLPCHACPASPCRLCRSSSAGWRPLLMCPGS
jgi:hypothetical protein